MPVFDHVEPARLTPFCAAFAIRLQELQVTASTRKALRRPGLTLLIASPGYRQPSAGATWVRIVSMTWAL